MAIYSLHHQPIGKSTQAKPFTAAAHIGYISRRGAVSRVDAARIPARPHAAARHFREMESGDRKNARVADKIRLALPVELNPKQRAALVLGFAEDLTQGRAGWFAAFHDKGKDAHNPHCHLVVRDRDHETGKRVIGTSENGSTGRIRDLWEQHANRALEAAGRPERVDRRTLAAQGIDREPTIHEGPRAQAMDRRGVRPRSQERVVRNGRGARRPTRAVDYSRIDRGRSRPEHNRHIRGNTAREDLLAAIDADRQRREFEALGYGPDYDRYLGAKREGRGMAEDQEKKGGLFGRIGDAYKQYETWADQASSDFLHDPTKPVKTGKDAPLISNTYDWVERPMTPREQQEMNLPEAVYKKVLKPRAKQAFGWLKDKVAPSKSPETVPPGAAPDARNKAPDRDKSRAAPNVEKPEPQAGRPQGGPPQPAPEVNRPATRGGGPAPAPRVPDGPDRKPDPARAQPDRQTPEAVTPPRPGPATAKDATSGERPVAARGRDTAPAKPSFSERLRKPEPQERSGRGPGTVAPQREHGAEPKTGHRPAPAVDRDSPAEARPSKSSFSDRMRQPEPAPKAGPASSFSDKMRERDREASRDPQARTAENLRQLDRTKDKDLAR